MTAGHIPGIAATLATALAFPAALLIGNWLLDKLFDYLRPISDNRSEHFPDGEWRG